MHTAYSRRYDTALAFAARAHHGQMRKGTDVPYLVHPVQVSMLLLAHGFDEDLAIAGLLHDTVEDCGVSADVIREDFGPEVARLVTAVSEIKGEDGVKRPWRLRKEEQLEHLAHADARVAALKAADALHNSASTLAELQLDGPSVWERFNAAPEASLWYYREVARLCNEVLHGHALARELQDTVEAMAAASAP